MSTKRCSVSLVAALAALLFTGGAFGGEAKTLTNDDVIDFVQANISPHLVIEKIRGSAANFDLSPTGVSALRSAGVPDEVLAAMMASGSSLAPLPGIGIPSRSSLSPSALEPPPSLGEIPPSPFPTASSPFTALDPLPSMPPLGGSSPSATTQAAAPAPTPAATPAPAAASTLPAFPAMSEASSALSAPPLAMPSLTPPAPAVSASPAAPSPAPVAAPTPTPAFDANRFRNELTSISSGSPEARRKAMVWLLAEQQTTLQPLRDALREQRPEIQAAAVYALGTMRDAQSLAKIRRLLASPSQAVRFNAAEVLAAMEDADSIADAEQALTSSADPLDGYIRLVGHARLVRTAGNLAAILANNRSADNRAAAAWSLASIGRAASVAWTALENALLQDADGKVRREAARAVAVFHDPSSAALLEKACRRDPEVRKTTLQGMADYPESIGFLVGVMSLSGDQIAADELEAAGNSLFKLTGQDLGMDGRRWAAWYADNKARLAASAQPAPQAPSSPALPPPPSSAVMASASSRAPASSGNGQIDQKAWGIIIDPNDIPMAPEVDKTPNLRRAGIAGGVVPPPPGIGIPSTASMPPSASSDIVEGPMGAQSGASSMFGGWSSGMGTSSPSSSSSVSSTPGGSLWGGGSSGDSAAAPGSSLPAPVSSSAPMAVAPEAPTSGEGMRLPLPPGLLGAAGGDDTPLYSSPSFGSSSSSAPSAPATIPSSPYGDDPYASAVPASPTYSPYSESVVVPSPAGVYSAPSIPIPSTDAVSGTSYGSPSSFTDEINIQPYESTADLVPEAARSVPLYTGQPEPSLLGEYADAEPVIQTVTESAEAWSNSVPPAPADAASPDAADYNTLSFPGDTDAFGLGDPYFADDDASSVPPPPASSAPSLFQGMVAPPSDSSTDDDDWDSPVDDARSDAPAMPAIPSGAAESTGESPDSFFDDFESDDFDDLEVEDLSKIPAFDDIVSNATKEESATGVPDAVEINAAPPAPLPSAPAASSSTPSMTITTERSKRASAPSSAASSSGSAAPVAVPVPAPAPVAAPTPPSPPPAATPAPMASASGTSDRASRILSALAEIENGGSSRTSSAQSSAAPSASAPLTVPPEAAVTSDGDFSGTGEFLTEDELFEVNDDSSGAFVPPLPSDAAFSGSAGSAEPPLSADRPATLLIPAPTDAP